MTLPNERIRAIRHTRRFLELLANPLELKRIPSEVRLHACYLLKHYPTEFETDHLEAGDVTYFKSNPMRQLNLKGTK